MSTLTSPPALRFTIVPLPHAFVQRVRTTRRDDFDRPVEISLAHGGEPMRDQLRRAEPGERLILCSYQAVALPSAFAEIGPIYVSADAPAITGFADDLPAGYFNRTFALRAYDAADRIIESALTEPADAPEKIRLLLARPATAYLHARFAGHGCFAARIVRGSEGPCASGLLVRAEPNRRRERGEDQRRHDEPGRPDRHLPMIDRPRDQHALRHDQPPSHRQEPAHPRRIPSFIEMK